MTPPAGQPLLVHGTVTAVLALLEHIGRVDDRFLFILPVAAAAVAPCYHQAQQAEPGKVKLARVKREAKQVPQLVFNMEAWEKQLVTTGKAAGGKNLLKDAKRASIRDFKIKAQEEGDAQYAVEAGAAAAAAGGTAAGRGRGRGRGGTRGGRGAGRGGGSSGRSVRSGSGSVGNSAGRAPSGAASGSGQRGQEDSVATEQGVEEEEGMEVDGARVREDDE